MAGKCETCRKEVGIRRKECDESGLAWHSNCFYCRICRVPLNEKTVNIRGEKNNKLYCGSHVIFQKGIQPICKVYYEQPAYRVVF